MVNKMGIMQGRLLPPIDGRLQAFPGSHWASEFSIAEELGIGYIEMIYDIENIDMNPLETQEGIEKLQSVIQETGVNVFSICADYFMKEKLISGSSNAKNTLISLIERVSSLEVKTIVLPFVDESEIKTDEELNQLKEILIEVFDKTKDSQITLSLESSLPAERLVDFLKEGDHPRLKINYDTGNSASLGYDLFKEIKLLGPWIEDIHIKDRQFQGESVPLGEGDTDFEGVFQAMQEIQFDGILVLQAQRQEDERETIKQYINFVDENYFQLLGT